MGGTGMALARSSFDQYFWAIVVMLSVHLHSTGATFFEAQTWAFACNCEVSMRAI